MSIYAFETQIKGVQTTQVTELRNIAGVKLVSIENETFQRWNVATSQSPYAQKSQFYNRQPQPRELTLRFEFYGVSPQIGYANLLNALSRACILADDTDRITITLAKGDIVGGLPTFSRRIKGTVTEFNEPRYEDRGDSYATLVFLTNGPWYGAKYSQPYTFQDGNTPYRLAYNNQGNLLAPYDIYVQFKLLQQPALPYYIKLSNDLGAFKIKITGYSTRQQTETASIYLLQEDGYAIHSVIPANPSDGEISVDISDVSGKLFKLLPESNVVNLEFLDANGDDIGANIAALQVTVDSTPLYV
jgi:hypothetical protein